MLLSLLWKPVFGSFATDPSPLLLTH